MTCQTRRKIHEQLAGTGALHERTEDDKDEDIGCRHRQRDAEDALGGHVKLVKEALRLDIGDQQGVPQKDDGGQRERPAEHPAHRLHQQDDHEHAHDHVSDGQVIDIEDAIDDVIVIDEEIQNRRYADEEQHIIENCRRFTRLPASSEQQKGQHHRKQKVRATKPDRFGRADADRPHVIDDHRAGYRRDSEMDDSRVAQAFGHADARDGGRIGADA